MKAIVLAAGRGSRLGSLTDDKPKCLVSINRRTLLDRAISALRAGGVSSIAVVGGYRSELVSPFADHLFLNPTWSSSGIFSSLCRAQTWLEGETCLVTYSDIFFGSGIVRALSKIEAPIAIAFDPNAVELWRQRFSNPLADLETFAISPSGYVSEIGGRPKDFAEVQGQYMGLLRIHPVGWQALLDARATLERERQPLADMTTLLSIALARGITIAAVPTEEPWGEVDTPQDIAVYERLYPTL